MVEGAKYKHIAVRPETHEKFQRFGRYGENADEILTRLLQIAENAEEFSKRVEENTKKD